MPKWVRDFLILPLIVGLIIAVVAYGLPKLFSDKLELSYEIDGPTRYLSDPAMRDLEILVNGQPTREIVGYRVRLWNSGNKPIKALPVRITFEPKQSNLSILSLRHNTSPQYEFGVISDLESEEKSRRFLYDLLNESDQDIVTILTNGDAAIGFFAKAEGLKVIQRQPGEGPYSWMRWSALLLLGAAASVLSGLLAALFKVVKLKLWFT